MAKFEIPDFNAGEIESVTSNGDFVVTKVIGISKEEHEEYLEILKKDGFKETEFLFYGGSPFRTFIKENNAVFVSYYGQWKTMFVKQSGKMDTYETNIDIPDIDFGIVEFAEKENYNASVVSVIRVSMNDFNSYSEKVENLGFELFESRIYGGAYFKAYKKGKDAVYLNYYPSVSELRVVAETNSAYINFSDSTRAVSVPTLITQLNISDYGISEVIRLSDGRFIIIDGGWHYEREVDKLMACLNRQKPECDEKPVIAAWILTHPHCDHYWCFVRFYEKYKQNVVVETVLYNFNEPDEYFEKTFPGSFWEYKRWGTDKDYQIKLANLMKESGYRFVCPHTGQKFQVGNASFEILSSPDDVIRTPVAEGNSLSLITRMELEGQVITWFGDGYFVTGKLVERFGSYLKSDIMQLPHHGFTGGTVEGYDAVDPDVVLATVFDDYCFATNNIYREENYHLCCELNVKEFIAGKHYAEDDVTIQMPYTPKKEGVEELKKMVEDGQGSLGARIWYFNDIVLEEGEDCWFTLLNTATTAPIYVTLFFENGKTLSRLKYIVGGMKRINISGTIEDDGNPVQEFTSNYPEKVVPAGVRFCVKFESRRPMVVSSEGRQAAYHY